MISHRVKIYTAAGIFAMLLVFNIVRTIPNVVEDVSGYPEMTYEEIATKHNVLKSQIEKPFSNYDDFFSAVDGLLALELACKKYEYSHQSLDPRYPSGVRMILGEISFLRTENEGRGRRFMFAGSLDERMAEKKSFEEADKKRDRTLSNLLLFQKSNPEAERRFYQAMLIFQFGFVPLVFLIYAIRIHDEDGSVVFEAMSNPLFPLYIFFWEVGLFKYRATGFRIQIRRMARYASLTLSTVLSFGAVTAKAQNKKDDGDTVGGNSHTLVISGNTQYLTTYLGLNGAVFHPKPVLQSSVSVAHTSGLYAAFWKSVAVTGSNPDPNFGQEEDYALGYSRKFGKRSVDMSATYFNVSPLQKRPRGDLVQLGVTLTNLLPRLPVSHYLWVRNVRPLKDGKPIGGWFAHFGTNQSVKLGEKNHLALGAEAVFDSGAFGFRRAGILRSSASLKIPWKNLIFDLPVFRMSTPFTSPGDGRKLEKVIGVGLSFSLAQ